VAVLRGRLRTALPLIAHGEPLGAGALTILTARLRLRARTLADLEAIVAMDADPAVRRFIGGPLDPVLHRAEVRRNIVEGRPEPHASWAVEWRDRPGLLGLCGLSPASEVGSTQIGWWLLPSAWGNG
jgi:RimJ/RimL family protein N-acetyltransferase